MKSNMTRNSVRCDHAATWTMSWAGISGILNEVRHKEIGLAKPQNYVDPVHSPGKFRVELSHTRDEWELDILKRNATIFQLFDSDRIFIHLSPLVTSRSFNILQTRFHIIRSLSPDGSTSLRRGLNRAILIMEWSWLITISNEKGIDSKTSERY
jgi:hypothetical protein